MINKLIIIRIITWRRFGGVMFIACWILDLVVGITALLCSRVLIYSLPKVSRHEDFYGPGTTTCVVYYNYAFQ